MPEIFSRSQQVFAGAFPVDGARVSFSGQDGNILGVGLLTQNLTYSYQQPITVLYELGSNNGYMVAGRARGNAGMARVLGPRPLLKNFYVQYGNVCNAASNHLALQLSAAACTNGPGTISATLGMNYAVITSVGGSITSENSLFSENVAVTFLTLDLS